MPEYSQIQRLIRILQILSSGRKITTKELRHRFDGSVSLRTLQRDLLTLLEAGIPLLSEKIRANENSWSLMSRFRSFIPLPLETNEYLAAHMLKENLKIFRHTPFEKEIQSLIDKIDQIVPEDVFLELKLAGGEHLFENYSAGLFDYTPYGKIVNDLISAIIRRIKCLVTYRRPDLDKPKSFYIEPEKMVYYSGGLYVIAYIRKHHNFIILAIQRMRNLKLTGDVFPDDHPFDPERYRTGKFGLFPGEQVEVKLQFSKEIRHHIEGRRWHSSQEITTDKSGNLILTMKVGISPELVSWVLSWQSHVKVLAPETLIEEIKRNAEIISEMY